MNWTGERLLRFSFLSFSFPFITCRQTNKITTQLSAASLLRETQISRCRNILVSKQELLRFVKEISVSTCPALYGQEHIKERTTHSQWSNFQWTLNDKAVHLTTVRKSTSKLESPHTGSIMESCIKGTIHSSPDLPTVSDSMQSSVSGLDSVEADTKRIHEDSGIVSDNDSVFGQRLDLTSVDVLSPRSGECDDPLVERHELFMGDKFLEHFEGQDSSVAPEIKPTLKESTVLPLELLADVTRFVREGKTDLKLEEGDRNDAGQSEELAEQSPKKKKPRKRRKQRRGVSPESLANEDSTGNKPADEPDEESGVYDISRLFSADFDKAYQKFQKSHSVWKRKNRKGKSDENIDDSEDKPKRLPPTHFISMQIGNPEIHRALKEVQEAVLKVEKRIEKAMVSIATVHLTLMVIRLETDEDITRAGETLDKCVTDHWSELGEDCSPLEIQVAGLGHFDHKVMFAKVTDGPQLDRIKKIAERIERCFAEGNISKADDKEFNPHITLMKFSKDRSKILRKKGIKKIDPSLYADFVDKVFGLETLTTVQLCSMMKPKNSETGYYHIEHETKFPD